MENSKLPAQISQPSPEPSVSTVTSNTRQQLNKGGGGENVFSKLLPGAKSKVLFIIFAFMGVLLLVLLLLLGLRDYGQKGEKDLVLAMVGNKEIKRSDVQTAAKEQYLDSAIDNKVLQIFLDNLIEREIMDQEALKLGISISNAEAVKKARELQSSVNINETMVKNAKYELLKDKIIKGFINSRTVFVVSYWTPSSEIAEKELTEEEKQQALIRREQGERALSEIESLINQDTEPYEAVKIVSQKTEYKEVSEILSVNGALISKLGDVELLKNPKIYTDGDKAALGEFYDKIFAMREGEVKTFFDAEKSTGRVVKVVKVSDGFNGSYAEWLNLKRTELVKKVNPI